MKTYHGVRRDDGRCEVWVEIPGRPAFRLCNRFDAGHPFDWGSKTDPALMLARAVPLARCLLWHVFRKWEWASWAVTGFCWIVGTLPDEWWLTEAQVQEWFVARSQGEAVTEPFDGFIRETGAASRVGDGHTAG